MPPTAETAEDIARPGHLLHELGYGDETEASLAIGVTVQTMAQYRKSGIGPQYTEIARRIFYSRDALAAWLAAGGTRSDEKK